MKYKTILASVFALTIASVLSSSAYGQNETYTAPVAWARYKSADFKVSFLMPKLPVVIDSSNECIGEMARSFGSYANGVAFVVRTAVKVKVPKSCLNVGKFGEANVAARLTELKLNGEVQVATNDANVIKLTGERRITKLVKDFDNDRWIELSVLGADESNTAVAEFLRSLEKGNKTDGTEIGKGADRVLGDGADASSAGTPDAPVSPKVAIKNPNGSGSGIGVGGGVNPVNPSIQPQGPTVAQQTNTRGVQIAHMARATYTNRARMEEIQGKVVLRVTFLASGGIGAISVIAGLKEGLTEEAIAAAKKILFIPASRNGIAYTVSKPVEYSFSLY